METGQKDRTRCDARFERALARRGYAAIAGLDEAGRGSLFGPVVAAAVVLPVEARLDGVRDSKQLAPAIREKLASEIASRAAAWSVASVNAADIDRINIYQASRLAMRRAVLGLASPPDFLLVDAIGVDLPLPQRALIRGDARSRTIAAASILAKVHRDRAMREWDEVYPQYGLARSKGYGTREHLAALARFGPTAQHRLTFEPVREALGRGQMSLELAAAAGAG
ncbi:MAG TPA: ribonuclease HII [Bryobacteraceae bacterium]|nr:ribonuclease HII [Bryobacteraceae bacterium]